MNQTQVRSSTLCVVTPEGRVSLHEWPIRALPERIKYQAHFYRLLSEDYPNEVDPISHVIGMYEQEQGAS